MLYDSETEPPLKSSPPDNFMINFYIQNCIPFSVPSLFSSGLRRIRERRGGSTETKQDPLGPSQYKSSFMFHFFFVEKKSISHVNLPQAPKSRIKQLVIRNSPRTRGPPEGTRITTSPVSSSCSAEAKTPSRWRMVTTG